ncbi:transposase [Mycobacterium tuberculosis]|nr:transposase [Mycobacterium tuberculosis]SGO49341.1 transposase [Mycobacterium tuberculosis]
MSARLERDLLAAGQQVVRVPTKLMAQTRKSARSRGESHAPIKSRRPVLLT